MEGACVSGTPEDDASLIDLGGEEDASEDAADAAPDTPLLDIAEDGEESDAPEEGGFLWPCEGDSDCDSGFCVETDGGDVCTVLCDGECPDPTWECRLYAGAGGDVVRLCVPPNEIACDPCSNDTECGFATDLCLDLADGSFCGEDCAEGRGCAEGFRCDEVLRDVDGASVVFEQCVPESGFCGDCVDNDRDGFGEGEGCRGVDCADDDDARFEGAPELCNGLDDDCDDEEDEGFDLATDTRHCGSCGNACEAARAEVACEEGVCAIVSCEEGWTDTNGAFEDGCENECTPTNEGVELCDEIDNDCDGEVDEDFDLDSDPLNCRVCDNVCLIPQGEPACVEGACVVAACDPGSVDLNGLPEDGCEYACAPTEDPAEVCDGVDNDCDGVIDNDIDLATSTAHCGACGEACDAPNAESACVEGGCTLVGCNAGFYDVDGLYETGCEYACTFLGASELCDDEDQDCDGRVDEGFTLATDEDNCGSCGRVCALADAEEVCIDGVCEVQACLGNYADCDMESENGCEVDLRSDEDNCGACGDTCDLPNAFSRCDEGARRDRLRGDVAGLRRPAFNGCESNRIADPLNCGFCSNQCLPANGAGTCNAGFCAIVSCEPEYADCDLQPNTGLRDAHRRQRHALRRLPRLLRARRRRALRGHDLPDQRLPRGRRRLRRGLRERLRDGRDLGHRELRRLRAHLRRRQRRGLLVRRRRLRRGRVRERLGELQRPVPRRLRAGHRQRRVELRRLRYPMRALRGRGRLLIRRVHLDGLPRRLRRPRRRRQQRL